MVIECMKCKRRFDDEFRDTGCPHATFAANDGQNNFAHHPESFLEPDDLERHEGDLEDRARD